MEQQLAICFMISLSLLKRKSIRPRSPTYSLLCFLFFLCRLTSRDIILQGRSEDQLLFLTSCTFLAVHLFSGRALRREEGGEENKQGQRSRVHFEHKATISVRPPP